MREEKRQSRDGFTMVEVLVVIAIIMLLSAIALPGFIQFMRPDHLSSATSTLNTMLRSARIYASTFHVDTAVVYIMNDYQPPSENDPDPDAAASNPPGVAGLVSPVAGVSCRVLRAAAVMYAMQADAREVRFRGVFVPAPGELGQFVQFPGEMGVFLVDVDLLPKTQDASHENAIAYRCTCSRFTTSAPTDPEFLCHLDKLGLSPVKVYARDAGPLVYCDTQGLEGYCDERYKWDPESMMAHVFKSTGRLTVEGTTEQERFKIFMAPPVTAAAEDRFINPDVLWAWDGASTDTNLVGKFIELTRSSGQVNIVQ